MKKIKVITVRVFVVLVVLLSSCKTYRNVENIQPKVSGKNQRGSFEKESISKLTEADKIIVKLNSGEEYFLYYKQLNGSNLIGTLWKNNKKKIEPNQRIEIPIDKIERVYAYRINWAVTIPVVLVSPLVPFGIYALLLSSY